MDGQQNIKIVKEFFAEMRRCFGPCYFIKKKHILVIFVTVTAVAQWLRCCATNRKVAGSIPGGVISNFCDCGRGGTVVKVLCYKSEGRCFDSRWCHWNFSLT